MEIVDTSAEDIYEYDSTMCTVSEQELDGVMHLMIEPCLDHEWCTMFCLCQTCLVQLREYLSRTNQRGE